jgi:hypothetical protein
VRIIDHISEVVAELRPQLPKLEQRFNEENEHFKRLLAADHSLIGHVLKHHLIMEVYLNRYLAAKYPNLSWDKADLRFAQKIDLLVSDADPRAQFVIPGIKELNRIRNRFGHRLDVVLSVREQTEMLKCLAIARKGVHYKDPGLVIQDFVTVACTFLIVNKDVEKVFEEAFSRVVKKCMPKAPMDSDR